MGSTSVAHGRDPTRGLDHEDRRRCCRTGCVGNQESGHLGSPDALSGHLGLTPSGLEALTTHATSTAGRDYDQGRFDSLAGLNPGDAAVLAQQPRRPRVGQAQQLVLHLGPVLFTPKRLGRQIVSLQAFDRLNRHSFQHIYHHVALLTSTLPTASTKAPPRFRRPAASSQCRRTATRPS